MHSVKPSKAGTTLSPPPLCYITLLVVAVFVLTGSTDGLYWLVPVMILLVVDASLNAWNLLLRLREPLKPA